jgi:F-type H+-transporting ATPase subunit b
MKRRSVLLNLCLVFALTLGVAARAQPTSPASNGGTAPAPGVKVSPAADGQPGTVGDRNAGAREPADEEAAFKFSPAVQGISHLTGLSLNAAYWLCVGINFALVVLVLWLMMKSSIPAIFRGRTQDIQKGIEEARRSSEEAQRRLGDVESRLSRMSVEIGEMQKRAEEEGRAEEERIRVSIQQEREKILQGAHQEVEQAGSAARRELQKFAAELAIQLAEKGLHIDAAADHALVNEFAEQLTARNGKG